MKRKRKKLSDGSEIKMTKSERCKKARSEKKKNQKEFDWLLVRTEALEKIRKSKIDREAFLGRT